jgi:hypothetical protein
MSHLPLPAAQISSAAREAARILDAIPGIHVMPSSLPASVSLVPLSQRPVHELRSRAAELAAMATTARTLSVRLALQSLATRFAEFAAQRESMDAQCAHRTANGDN